jgi:hypothetical protein
MVPRVAIAFVDAEADAGAPLLNIATPEASARQT